MVLTLMVYEEICISSEQDREDATFDAEIMVKKLYHNVLSYSIHKGYKSRVKQKPSRLYRQSLP